MVHFIFTIQNPFHSLFPIQIGSFMWSRWVPDWVGGDYVGEDDDNSYRDDADSYEDDDHNYEDDVNSYEDDDDSYKDDDDEDDIDSYGDDDDIAAYSSLGLVVGSPSENSASKSPQILERGWNEAKRSQASIKYGMRPKYGNTEWGEGITALTQIRN